MLNTDWLATIRSHLFPVPKRSYLRRKQKQNVFASIEHLEPRLLLTVYAIDDSFMACHGAELDVATSGVLSNDYDDGSGGSLSAVLVDDVEHGTLSLQSDG